MASPSIRRGVIYTGVGIMAAVIIIGVFDIGGISRVAAARDLSMRLMPPGSHGHLLGTDGLGRDILARLVIGARYTFGIAALATLIAGVIGVGLGLLAVVGPSWFRALVSRFVDLTIAFPSLVLAIVMVGMLGRGNLILALSLGLFYWPTLARVTLAQGRGIEAQQYVTAARLFGVSRMRIIFFHILPGIAPTVSVVVAFQFANLLISTAGLSFLGLGPPLGVPEWGSMLAEARAELTRAPWLLLGPGLAVAATVILANLIGDELASKARAHRRSELT
jgi:ABC-type dipeptide/oligopeptide/nickel transport system permease subunit